MALKYAKNFYLYCMTNPEIRSAAKDLLKKVLCLRHWKKLLDRLKCWTQKSTFILTEY